MKVLQVNCVFRHGSTGKIVDDIHKVLLQRGIESVVCYGRGRHKVKPERNVYKFCTELESDLHHVFALFGISLAYGGNYIPTRRLIKIIVQEKPDIVHLHCINGYCVNIFDLLRYLGQNEIHTVITNHAEFFYTGNCGHAYDCEKWRQIPGCGQCPMLKFAIGSIGFDRTRSSWQKMRNAFSYHTKENLIFVAVSPWVKYRLNLSPVTEGFNCEVVENGVDTNIFRLSQPSQSVKDRIGYLDTNEPLVFHVTATFSSDPEHLKGGYYILEVAKRMPKVKFVVAAIDGDVSTLPSNVLFLGRTHNQQELVELYSCADVTLVTSKRETYSMVTAESLCCGTPVVGFKAGGPETIALPEYSRFVEYGNVDELVKALREMLTRKEDKETISEKAKLRYSKERMTDSYLEIYHTLLHQE